MMNATLSPLASGDPLPLHRRAEHAIRELIAGDRIQGGALLPDEIAIAEQLAVSRGTVRAALGRLVAEGVIERKSGVGTRVVRRAAESAVSAWHSLTREMARRGIKVQLFRANLRTERAPVRALNALRLVSGTSLQRLHRVRGWDDMPAMSVSSWFHPRARIDKGADFTKPFYDILKASSGLSAERSFDELSAVIASGSVAKDLRVSSGYPLLLRRRTVFDAAGRPLEYSEVHYVSKRFTLTLDLKREGL